MWTTRPTYESYYGNESKQTVILLTKQEFFRVEVYHPLPMYSCIWIIYLVVV